MSRSGYDDYADNDWSLIRYRGQVASAIRGKRGQAFLRELRAALDAMSEKRLIEGELRKDGEVFGVAHQLIQEIEYENDEASYWDDDPERRWERVRQWTEKQIRQPK